MPPRGVAGITWWKSTRCESQHCVEVARVGDGMAVRDSIDPTHHLRFGARGWQAFLGTLRTGSWDRR